MPSTLAELQARVTPGLRFAPELTVVLSLLPSFVPFHGVALSQQNSAERHHYAIESLTTGEVLRRGTTTAAGLPDGSVILGPNRRFRLWLHDVDTGRVGHVEFTTPANGQRFTIPKVELGLAKTPDFDRDGLSDDAEFIIGTDPRARDTDGDGIADGAEVAQGSDPSDDRPARTGIIATADTPGNAVDISAFNDVAAIADANAGVSVFNVFNAMEPVKVAELDTPGTAARVACAADFIAVADGAAGLAIVDFRVPASARVLHQVSAGRLGGAATAVAVAGGIAYAGTELGFVAAVDLASGEVLDREFAGAAIFDLGVGGDTLFVLFGSTLEARRLWPYFPERQGTTPVSARAADVFTRSKRLAAGERRVFASAANGFDVVDVSDVRDLQLVDSVNVAGLGGTGAFKQIVENGSGLGIACVGVTATPDATHNVSVYRLGDPVVEDLESVFATPGVAHAAAIYNGLAYVADGARGLQVVNYRAFDSGAVPPTIALSANFSLVPALAEEGSDLRVTAAVADDVQVRNVEFWVDGVRVVTDGSFPFEHRFTAPRIDLQSSFRLRARASDTGGNATWTEQLIVELSSDRTPPRVVRVLPSAGAVVSGRTSVRASFSEPLDPATITTGTFRVGALGPGGLPGGVDESAALAASVTWNEDTSIAVLGFDAPLAPGVYVVVLSRELADLAGNTLAAEFRSLFHVVGGIDSDGDGLPDAVELALGLDPANADSDGDGVPDGEEDSDGDGLANAAELVLGSDPGLDDSDGDGIRDGDEDSDFDGIPDALEFVLGTLPRDDDTDRDGWPDGVEAELGSDPVERASRPRLFVRSSRRVAVVLPRSVESELPRGVSVATPRVTVRLPQNVDVDIPLHVTVSRPRATVIVPASETVAQSPNVIVGRPPVAVEFEKE